MSKEKIYIFDTTLRDGAQTEGVDFSIEDKIKIAKVLSDIGVDYVEGGWPGANPVDTKFFSNPPKMQQTLFTAFGMTKKTGRSADNDPGLASLMNANTPGFIAKIHELYTNANKGDDKSKKLFNSACKLIGLFDLTKNEWEELKKVDKDISKEFIENKIKERLIAKQKGDYKLADKIRVELANKGVIIEDKKEKTTWKFK